MIDRRKAFVRTELGFSSPGSGLWWCFAPRLRETHRVTTFLLNHHDVLEKKKKRNISPNLKEVVVAYLFFLTFCSNVFSPRCWNYSHNENPSNVSRHSVCVRIVFTKNGKKKHPLLEKNDLYSSSIVNHFIATIKDLNWPTSLLSFTVSSASTGTNDDGEREIKRAIEKPVLKALLKPESCCLSDQLVVWLTQQWVQMETWGRDNKWVCSLQGKVTAISPASHIDLFLKPWCCRQGQCG